MKRWLIAMTTFVLVTAACTAGGGSSDAPSAVDTGSGASHAPVTLQMWGAWTGRELQQFNKIFDGFTAEVPVDHGQQRRWRQRPEDHRRDQRRHRRPTSVLSFTLDSVGQFCASGAWQDLNPYIQQSGFDVSQFPPSVEAYTSFAGSRCAFPFLTDALRSVLQHGHVQEGGITRPAEDAHRARDGREEAHGLQLRRVDQGRRVRSVVGLLRVQQHRTWGTCSARSGTRRTAQHRRSPPTRSGRRMFHWQHDFIANVYGGGDFQTGSDKLQRFVAGAGDEFSSAQDFETGRVGDELRRRVADGVHRRRGARPSLRDGAATPARRSGATRTGAVRSAARSSGSRRVRRTPTRRGCWSTYMATDTATLVYMANNVRNVPTTLESLSSPDLDVTPQFQTFLDIFKNPDSHYKEPSAIGAADQNILAALGREVAGGEGNGPRRRARERRPADQRSARASGDLARGTCDEHDRSGPDRGSSPRPTPSFVGPGNATSGAA